MRHAKDYQENGLNICRVCFGSEAAMPTECPMRPMTAEEKSAVSSGMLDFNRGQWWRPTQEPEHQDAQGAARKQHYGSGKQPWDTIQELGWGPAFAAGNVLKYLRRTKTPEEDLVKASWYAARLREMAIAEEGQRDAWYDYWLWLFFDNRFRPTIRLVRQLEDALTPEEIQRIKP